MSNARGHYGSRIYVGADASSGRSRVPWLLGSAGLVGVVAVLRAYSKRPRPQLSAHEKEVRAWETEFPGLPWFMDAVKDSRQLDMWERARDHWERTHG